MNLFVGRALHLDPRQLIGNGAAASCPDRNRLHAHHMFLCLGLCPCWGIWLPLRGDPSPGRIEMGAYGRDGHQYWVGGVFYYDPTQMWFIPNRAVEKAAQRDNSSDTKPNYLARMYLPKVWDLLELWPWQKQRVERLLERFDVRYTAGT